MNTDVFAMAPTVGAHERVSDACCVQCSAESALVAEMHGMGDCSACDHKHVATYHGIVRARCLSCGYESRDATELTMWNDYGEVCINTCSESAVSEWELVDGSVTRTDSEPAVLTDVGGTSDMKLGYGACALPLILDHNTPNNAISLLWAETSGESGDGTETHAMRPLFRRRQRHV